MIFLVFNEDGCFLNDLFKSLLAERFKRFSGNSHGMISAGYEYVAVGQKNRYRSFQLSQIFDAFNVIFHFFAFEFTPLAFR